MPLLLKPVDASRGPRWVGDAFRLFARKPLAFTALFAVFLFGAMVVSLLPLLGGVLQMMALPLLSLGFMVAGQFQVSVPAGLASGTLLNYQVKRPLNLTYGSWYTNLQTWVIGFSQPPTGGTYAPTTGLVNSYLEISGQPANVPLSLTNGAAIWNINMPGPSFNYVSGVDAYLVSDFQLDGSRLSGSAGTWIVDLPVLTKFLPEPAALSLISFAGLTTLPRRTR